MAYTSDVETAFVNLAASVYYPSGVTADNQVSPAASSVVHISRGWPTPTELDHALFDGEILVTVWPQSTHSRLVDGYLETGYAFLGPPVSMTVSVAGSVITLAGTPTAGQLVGALVDGQPYAYLIQHADTLTDVATGLALLINEGQDFLVSDDGAPLVDDDGNPMSTTDFATVSAGPPVTITLATNRPIKARTAGNGTFIGEYRWQEEVFRLIVWAPSPDARDRALNALDLALAQVKFLTLPNSPLARVLWQSTERSDTAMKADLFRADLCFTVRFCTTSAHDIACLLWGDLEVQKQVAGGGVIVTHTEIF